MSFRLIWIFKGTLYWSKIHHKAYWIILLATVQISWFQGSAISLKRNKGQTHLSFEINSFSPKMYLSFHHIFLSYTHLTSKSHPNHKFPKATPDLFCCCCSRAYPFCNLMTSYPSPVVSGLELSKMVSSYGERLNIKQFRSILSGAKFPDSMRERNCWKKFTSYNENRHTNL